MRILIADDDRKFLDFAQTTLRDRTRHDVSVVVDGMQAFEATLVQRPDVLVLDWLMPRMNGTQVCRMVRARAQNPDLYVMFVTSRGRRQELLECLNAGADDLLVKPVPPDLLVARIELAAQRSPGEDALISRMRQALTLASAQQEGELVVRGGGVSARVFFHGGKVAWTQLDDGSGTFLQSLATEVALDADTVAELVDECRRTQAKLTDVIAQWGLVDPEQVRASLKGWLSKQLATIVALPNARSLFLPQRSEYADDLAFSLDALWGDAEEITFEQPPTELRGNTQPSLIPVAAWKDAFVLSPQTSSDIEAILDRCIADEGVLGVVALERTSGICLGSRGVELNPDIAWAHIQCLNAVMREGNVEDSIVTTDEHYHLVRLLPDRSETFLYALVSAHSIPLAMARLKLQFAIQG